MKKLVFLFVFFISWFGHTQTLDSLFVKANKLYQQESYLQALKLYQEIENKNVKSSDLYYNMANIYYKTNQVAPSIYYYEKGFNVGSNG